MNKLDYDEKFYQMQRKDNILSAKIIVPLVLEILEGIAEKTVIDLGCGSGNWLSVFKDYGFSVTGVDGGGAAARNQLMIQPDEFIDHDFRLPFKSDKVYALAMSLECAEHVPASASDPFVDSLVALSDIILFSAAIPHQRGRGHVNEQYPSYWVDKFDQRGYQVYDVLRRSIWNNPDVRAFYAQNIFLYINRNSSFYQMHKDEIMQCNDMSMIDVVNPRIWEDLNEYKLVKFMDIIHNNPVISWIYYRFVKQFIKFR